MDCPPPKKFRTQPAGGKSYDNNFGDSEELQMVDYLPSKKTIIAGSILSVESNENLESKTKNVESKIALFLR